MSSSTVQISAATAAAIVGVAALGAAQPHGRSADDNRGPDRTCYVEEVTSMSAGDRAATYGNVVDYATAIRVDAADTTGCGVRERSDAR